MTDPSPLSERRAPARRRDDKITDFTMLVRAPGNRGVVGVFTDAEEHDAAEFAKSVGGVIEQLPL
ncbi:MAG: hypothetical protein WCE30_10140 [Mycobacterium sp.]